MALAIFSLLGSASTTWASISLIALAKTASGPDLVENITAKMPESLRPGLICLAQIATSGDNYITAPAGWATIRADINAHDATQGLYWHLTNDAEPHTYTWTTGGEIAYESVIACYSGVNTTAPVDPGSPNGSGAVTHGTTITAPAIRLQTGGDLIIGAFQAAESQWGQGVSINLPSSLSARWSMTDADATFEAMAGGDRTKRSNGLAEGLTITTNNGLSSDALIGQQVALQPDNPGSAPPPSSANISYLASTTTASGADPANPTLNMPSAYAVPRGSVCIADLSTLGANTLSAPSGWHQIRVDSIGYQATQGLYWHVVASDEPTQYTWDAGGTVYYEGVISCYYGIDNNTPVDPGAPNGSGSVAQGTSVAAPSIVMASTGDLIFAAFMAGESNWGQGVVINMAAGLTTRSSLTDNDAPYMASSAGDALRTSAGPTGSLAITTANGVSTDGLVAQQVAFQPANASPSPTPTVTPTSTPLATPTPTPTATASAAPTPLPTSTPTATPSPTGGISLDGFTQSAGGGNLTPSITVQMPTSISAGDICIAHLAVSGPNNLVVPTGWNTIREDLNGYNDTQGLYWHTAVSNEPAAYTWSTFNGQVLYEAAIGCFSGVNQTTPLDPGAPHGAGAIANGTSVTAPSITTQSSGDLVIAASTAAESSWGQGVIVQPPSGTTTFWSATDSSADYLSNAAAGRQQNDAGPTGTLTFTTVNGASTDALIAQVIAIQPAK
jgi:hypothetical protein